jgi:hypothetical protein
MGEAPERQGWRRGLAAAPWFTLALGMALESWVGLRWLSLEARVGEPVVCEAIWPVNDLITATYSGQLEASSLLAPGLISWLGMAGHALLGGGGRSLLLTMLLCMLGCQLLAFDIGRLLGDRWIGVIAALLLPLFPDLATVGRRWGPILPQLLLLLAMADLLIRSRSLSRPPLALGVGLLGAVGTLFSPFSTHNLIFLAAAGSLCAGAAGRGLLLGRPPVPGEPVPRWRVALGSVLAALPTLLAAWVVIRLNTDPSYYTSEANAETYAGAGRVLHPLFLTTYLRHIATSSAGPLLTVATVLGLAGFVWRGRARAELLLWGLLPLAALTLIAKKNWYYIAVIFPVLPLLAALGLRAIPWKGARVGAGLALVMTAGWGWWQASLGEQAPTWYRRPMEDPALQSPAAPFMQPVTEFRWARHEALLRAALPGSSCPDGQSIGQLPDAPSVDLVLALKDVDPCLGTHLWAQSQDFDWLIHSDPHCESQPESSPGPVDPELRRPQRVGSCERRGLCTVISADLTEPPCLWLVRVEEAAGP